MVLACTIAKGMDVSFFLLYWIIAIISGATAIGFTIAALTRERALHLKRLLLFQC